MCGSAFWQPENSLQVNSPGGVFFTMTYSVAYSQLPLKNLTLTQSISFCFGCAQVQVGRNHRPLRRPAQPPG